MLYRALSIAAVRAGGIRGTSDPVHVSGNGCVVPAAKSGQVDPIYAWEVLFALCVKGWGGGS